MKEQLRVEIRKRLNQLEMRCSDMTSLLRGLGIHVGGSFPKEVSCVYILIYILLYKSTSLYILDFACYATIFFGLGVLMHNSRCCYLNLLVDY